MRKKTDIGCVIVNWNNKTDILACLASLKKHAPDLSVVVVDNGSTDGSPEEIRRQFANITILSSGTNLGYAGGNNTGIRHLLEKGMEYVLILNPDTLARTDFLAPLLRALEDNPSLGIVGPEIIGREEKVWSQGGVIDPGRYTAGLLGLGSTPTKRHETGLPSVDYIPGAAMLIRRNVLERIGLFHEPYFIYYEDVELSLRARRAGFGCAYVPDARIIHNESSSFGRASATQDYYLARNHLLFVLRSAPVAVKLREIVRLPKTILEHKERNQSAATAGIRDFFLGRFGMRSVTHG